MVVAQMHYGRPTKAQYTKMADGSVPHPRIALTKLNHLVARLFDIE